MVDKVMDTGINLGSDLDLSKILQGVSTNAPSAGAGGIDVATAIKSVDAASPGMKAKIEAGAQAGIQKQIQLLTAEGQAAKDQETQAEQMRIAQQALVEQMQNSFKQENDVKIANIANSLASPDYIVDITNKVRQQDAQLDAQLDDITKRKQVGFFDDPAQWMYEQFALPADIKAYNLAVQQRNATAEQRDGAVAAGTQAAAFIKSTQLAKSAEIVEAENKQIALAAMKKISEAAVAKAQFSLPFLQAASQVVRGTFTEQMQQLQYNLSSQEMAYKLRREKDDEALRKIQITLGEHQVKDLALMEASLSTINAKLGTKWSLTEFNSLPTETRQAAMTISMSAVGVAEIMPSDTLKAFKLLKTPLNPELAQLVARMDADMQGLEIKYAEATKKGMVYTTPEARRAAAEKEFNLMWGNFNNLPADDNKPGLGMPTFGQLNAYTGNGAALESNSVYKTLVGDNANNPTLAQSRLSTSEIQKAADALVSKGADPKKIALEATTLHQVITARNTQIADLAAAGLAPQTRWIAPDVNNPMQKFDRTNPAEWENRLVRQRAKAQQQQLLNESPTLNFGS